MSKKTIVTVFFLFVFALLLVLPNGIAVHEKKEVLLLRIDGVITTSTAEYVEEGLSNAGRYEAVIITINTFGGLGDPMFRIIEAIQNSESPVITYVYPQGGQALSAGTYILMASSIAAMAPYTVIGSAQPVVNGVPSNDTKLINFLVAKMESFAELYGRNATQAARFVTHNDNLGPEEALRLGVIEVIAEDIEDLLAKVDGMNAKTLNVERTLDLKDVDIVKFEPNLRIQVLSVLSDPLISAVLLSIGILLLIVGLSSPGFGAELAGAVLLVLGLIGQGFNVNLAGLILLALGAILVLYEFYTGGIGAAIIGGIALISLGLIIIIRAPPGEIYVSQEWLNELMITISFVAAGVGAIMAFLIFKALRVVRRRSYPLEPEVTYGRAVEKIAKDGEGFVVVGGEYRRAVALEDIEENQKVVVVGKRNGLLLVRKAS